MNALDGTLGALSNIAVEVTAELGRCTLRLGDALRLSTGSIVVLDRTAGSPIDLLVNDDIVARGDLIAIDDRYALQVTEIVTPGGNA
ncbi:MAG: FliM/FliN family flagellar motor switch protein [Candidatus Eremiobacteraeota bacterium]|nr:FliM/FliN family flagellar motor switch protein [Candidatus Eremiobacteraeota bacterium]